MFEQVTLNKSLLSAINSIFSGLYSSIDTKLYLFLDNLIFIDTDIFKDSFIYTFLGTSSSHRTYINLQCSSYWFLHLLRNFSCFFVPNIFSSTASYAIYF